MVSTYRSDQEQRRSGERIIPSGDDRAAHPPINNDVNVPSANPPINNNAPPSEVAVAAIGAHRAAAADAAETRRNAAQQIGALPAAGNDVAPAANPPAGSGIDVPAANPPAADDDFPSILTCPISGEPPVDAVTFEVEDENGQFSPQVFDRRNLFLHIAHQGDQMGSLRNVRHPLAGGTIPRDRALALVRNVPPDVQARINEQRRRLHLSLDQNPITQDDWDVYNRTVANVLHR